MVSQISCYIAIAHRYQPINLSPHSSPWTLTLGKLKYTLEVCMFLRWVCKKMLSSFFNLPTVILSTIWVEITQRFKIQKLTWTSKTLNWREGQTRHHVLHRVIQDYVRTVICTTRKAVSDRKMVHGVATSEWSDRGIFKATAISMITDAENGSLYLVHIR